MRLGQKIQALSRRLTRLPVPLAGERLPTSILAACVAVFAGVAIDITHRGLLSRLDPRVARWSFDHVTGSAHTLCRLATHLGDGGFLAVVVTVAVLWLLSRERRSDALLLPCAAAVSGPLTALLKEAFRRSRPVYVDPVNGPHSFSFPSGHSSGAFAVYVLTAVLVAARLTGRTRALLTTGALALATLVAATRVLLPVHYVTDVIAGASVGLAVAAAALLARAALASGR